MKTVNLTEEEHKELLKLRANKKTAAAEVVEDNVVRAAGTSEGAKKGWSKRTGGMTADSHDAKGEFFKEKSITSAAQSIRDVHDSFSAAHKASATAIRSDHPHDHWIAAVAHREAAGDAKAIGHEDQAKQHHKIADDHDDRGEKLDPEGKFAKASDTSSADIVHCRASSAAGEKTFRDSITAGEVVHCTESIPLFVK